MKLSKKKLIEALEERYHVIPLNTGYNLYDKTRKAKMMNGGAFVAQIGIGNSKYYWNDKEYKDVQSLSNDIDAYVDTLPFSCEYYDPTYRRHIFVELCCEDYLKNLGFNRIGVELFEFVDDFTGMKYNIMIDMKEDTTSGRIVKKMGDNRWDEMLFEDLDGAIADINTLVSVDALINASKSIQILSKMNGMHTKNEYLRRVVDMKNFEVKTKSMRDELIERLEKELEELKNMK